MQKLIGIDEIEEEMVRNAAGSVAAWRLALQRPQTILTLIIKPSQYSSRILR